MSLASARLPADPDALRAVAVALQAGIGIWRSPPATPRSIGPWPIPRRDVSKADRAKTLHIEKLKAQLAILRRARFGRSSEKLEQAIEQLELLIGDLEEGEAESEARSSSARPEGAPTATRSRRSSGRAPLPEHLPRETIVHPPPSGLWPDPPARCQQS